MESSGSKRDGLSICRCSEYENTWCEKHQCGIGGEGYLWGDDNSLDKYWVSHEQRMVWRWRYRDYKHKVQPNYFLYKCDFCFKPPSEVGKREKTDLWYEMNKLEKCDRTNKKYLFFRYRLESIDYNGLYPSFLLACRVCVRNLLELDKKVREEREKRFKLTTDVVFHFIDMDEPPPVKRIKQ